MVSVSLYDITYIRHIAKKTIYSLDVLSGSDIPTLDHLVKRLRVIFEMGKRDNATDTDMIVYWFAHYVYELCHSLYFTKVYYSSGMWSSYMMDGIKSLYSHLPKPFEDEKDSKIYKMKADTIAALQYRNTNCNQNGEVLDAIKKVESLYKRIINTSREYTQQFLRNSVNH